MPILLRFLLALGLAGPAAAALPPQYQRAAEFRALIADARVAGAFGSTPVERIEYVGPDLYRVSAGRCSLEVAIVDLPAPSGVAGPRRFGLRPGRKACGR